MEHKEKEVIISLIESGNIKKALEALDQFSSGKKEFSNNVIRLKSRYQINKRHELNATLDTKEIAIENNKIISSILELLNADEKDLISETKNEPSKNKSKTLLIFLFSFFGPIFLLLVFLFYPRNKTITGKVFTFQNGIEVPVQNCNIKIVNLVQQGVSTKTNEAGIFNLNVVGRNIQDLEFGLNHIDYEDITEIIRVDFRVFRDTIFSKEFSLKSNKK